MARGRSWWLVVACGGSCVVLETTIFLGLGINFNPLASAFISSSLS